MKLIIEIPEEQYNDIVKYLTNNDGNYAYSDFNLREIIRNGTPYNPSGDAISREVLKKEFDKECQCDCSVCEHSRFDSFKGYYHCGLIDNAPPVEPHRPQGEWQGGELGHCTNCGHKGSASDIWNNCMGMFCPNCGAELTDV